MRIVQQLDDVTYDRNSVVTVGSFDGIHRAHAELFRQAVARATNRKGRSVVVTFEPHPKEIVGAHPEEVRLLTTPDERSEACAEAGIDLLVVLRFDRTFAGLSSREFTKRFLVEGIGVAEVVEGYDHHWGRNREGDLATLRELGTEFGFDVMMLEPIRVHATIVSSSVIRTHLLAGDVREAAAFLGHSYEVRGTVVKGDERGRTLGYPTANVVPDDPRKLVPRNGIYVAEASGAGPVRGAMVSIGVRPTFHDDGRRTIEAHVLDFSGDLYGAILRLRFLDRLRDEQKFDSPAALIKQMKQDEVHSRQLLRARSDEH